MELEFQKSDFEKLMFRVDDMPDKVDPVEYFPKLKKWREFSPQRTWSKTLKNKIFKWIVLMYDKESPFRAKIGDARKRRFEVAKYVKLVTDFNLIDPKVESVLRGNDAEVNRMVIAYARMHRNSLYALVIGLDDMFYEDLFQVKMGNTVKKQITTTQRELETSITELLNQDNDAQLRWELALVMEEERLEIRPEDIAEIFASGKKPFEGEEVNYNEDD